MLLGNTPNSPLHSSRFICNWRLNSTHYATHDSRHGLVGAPQDTITLDEQPSHDDSLYLVSASPLGCHICSDSFANVKCSCGPHCLRRNLSHYFCD
ncbi:Vacuolar protein sorting-associated protein 74 [Fusarium oxysporum f. sp. albedinis]|nr:Vacuolar protein sorting-associated protein 74 [Fusarium oxysporum f. sp. albedinis]